MYKAVRRIDVFGCLVLFSYLCGIINIHSLIVMKHILFVFSLVLVSLSIFAETTRPLLVGHRGSRYGVENTYEAFRSGAQRGYEYVETDIKVTKDSKFVLTHDDNLKRWGHENLVVASSTLAQLQAVTLTQTRSGVTYTGKLMELGEFLDSCTVLNVKPVIELKWATGVNSNDQSNMHLLVKTIEDKGYRNKCIILTSMKPCLDFLHKNYPDMTLQLLVSSSPANHFAWCKARGIDVDLEESVCTDEIVDMYHEAGLKVNMWTTNTNDGYKKFATMGCDFITTDILDGNNLPAFDPKVVIPTIEGDYPDALAGTSIVPSESYTFRTEYADHAIPALINKTVRRVVIHKQHAYILAHDANNAPTILVMNTRTRECVNVSTEGMAVPQKIAEADPARLRVCADIQVSLDGHLLATNLAETTDAPSGEVIIYKWEKDAAGLPTGAPSAWIRSEANGALSNAYMGETFAYSGTTEKGNAYLSAQATTSAGNVRFAIIPIVNGTAKVRDFLHSVPPARGFMKQSDLGEDYRFHLSPLASDHIIVTDSKSAVTLADFPFVRKSSTTSTDVPTSLKLPAALTHVNFFRYAGAAYSVLPTATGFQLLDVTAGVDKASLVNISYTPLAEKHGVCASVGEVQEITDENGNISGADIDIFLLHGAEASLLTTRGASDGVDDIFLDENGEIRYYNLMGVPMDATSLPSGVYIQTQGSQATKVLIP